MGRCVSIGDKAPPGWELEFLVDSFLADGRDEEGPLECRLEVVDQSVRPQPHHRHALVSPDRVHHTDIHTGVYVFKGTDRWQSAHT